MMAVYVDDKYSFTIPEEDYLALNLYEKSEITAEELSYIKDIVSCRAAKSAAVKYLSLKLRSEKEVCDKLESEGFDREVISQVVSELRSMGYINDKMYAQKYIFDRSKLKPKSKKMLKLELLHKGIGAEIADEVLDGWQMQDEVVAESLVRRKFGKYDLSDENIKKKVYSFLSHRGFSFEIIEFVLKELGNGEGRP